MAKICLLTAAPPRTASRTLRTAIFVAAFVLAEALVCWLVLRPL